MAALRHRCQSFNGFERLLEEEELRKERVNHLRWVTRSAAAGIGLCVLLVVQGRPDTVVPPIAKAGDRKEHTIPTLLSVVHPETGHYLYALNNPLYDRLKTAEFHVQDETAGLRSSRRLRELPALSLHRTSIHVRQPVTLSWTPGKTNQDKQLLQDDDVIALYCPASEQDPRQFRDAATLAQVRATSVKHGGRPGVNEWHIPEFPVLRHDSCQFRLYHQTSMLSVHNDMHLLASSPVLHVKDSSRTPTGLHLAWTYDPSEMIVQFTTGDSGTPIAVYGISNGTTGTRKVEGASHTYAASDMCQEPANITEAGKFQPPGMLHVVNMTNLAPNQEYQYKVGLSYGQGIVWSDVHTFRSAPAVGHETPFSYVTYGDQGCPSVGWGDGGKWVAAMAAREDIRAVHHFGDLSYARGSAHIWDEWFNMISTFTASVPLMIGVGNHEYDHTAGGENGKDPSGLNSSHGFMPAWGDFGEDSGGECGVPTSQRFVMPQTNGSNGVFWYSHDYATVHTIMISSEHDLSEGSPQHKWLEADLKAVNRTLTPWLIVETHRPLYESEVFWENNVVGIAMRYAIEDLLYKYKVDMVLGGHYHAYLRTCDGLYQSKCDNGGPIHITVGSAGAQLDDGATLYEQDWTESFRNEEWGYGRITVMNRTTLHWEFVKAGDEDDQEAGAVKDDVWILRDR